MSSQFNAALQHKVSGIETMGLRPTKTNEVERPVSWNQQLGSRLQQSVFG